MEVGEAGEVVLPDEDVGVAQRRQVRQAPLERDRNLEGAELPNSMYRILYRDWQINKPQVPRK